MSLKHVYNSSDGLVLKSLQGAVTLNPSLRLHAPSKTVYVHPPSSNTQVSVISGGGAGHEPAHASYTGYGMLAASVSGDIFASPSAKQITQTLRLAAAFPGSTNTDTSAAGIEDPSNPLPSKNKKDILVIINNYTGDRLNFGLAIEKAKSNGLEVGSIVVADDVSLLHSPAAKVVGPRGLAGNILVCKVMGALAERGTGLKRMKEVGDAVVGNLASIGVGLEHCHVPGRETTKGNISMMESTECELGLGLHNEPGAEKKRLDDPEKLIGEMVEKIIRSRGEDDSFVRKEDETVLFVNNLGGMSQLEMGAILTDVVDRLSRSEINPSRIYLSSFMTSLNAPGFSLSLLNVSNIYRALPSGRGDLDVLQLLDDPTDALSWTGTRKYWPSEGLRDYTREEQETSQVLALSSDEVHNPNTSLDDATEKVEKGFWRGADISPEAVKRGIIRACQMVLEAEKDMTQFDTIAGDGDCGETFAVGAKAVLSAIDKNEVIVNEMSPASLVQAIGDLLEENMGGTIGALFAIYFAAWSTSLKLAFQQLPTSNNNTAITETLRFTPIQALDSLSHHTPAKPGDRTIIDALQPFCIALRDGKGINEAAKEAREGASRTRGMEARLGRAVYVGSGGEEGSSETDSGVGSGSGKTLRRELPPDPGAWGVAAIVEGFRAGFVGEV
ncbi:DAK1/DegV-like protein [Dendrothele bispora CBS 962.96]|uniref:DAK1/DegV-like protein n=1 Tax=Dendrothele bispora (strain CBS 962.96) TaxID=1314807 RepID=A0A4S8L283_DENBC|nr:DAK1/DegV-like protein [Dendrothele bispora CBS 962.96]THU82480.1 DAK1/DegV-like protein [Dendrothele bispora CBS 962.96]